MPVTLNNMPLVDPDSVLNPGDANSYRCPLGEAVGFAHVLMWKSDFDRLPATPACTLRFVDGDGRAVTVKYLQVVAPAACLQTDAARTDVVVSVKLADLRWRYRHVSANASYNYRDGAGVFYTASLNAGVAWTWQEVVTNLWGKYATPFGSTAAPTFPAAPTGTPEGFSFQGVDVWTALNRVVRAAGYVVRYDPTNGQVSIIDPNLAAPTFPPSRVSPRTFDDGLWRVPTDIASYARMPKSLTVAYPVVGSPTALLSSVATVAGQDAAGTAAVVWDDLPAFSGTNDAAVTNRTNAVRKLWEIDWLKAANPNGVEFLGWADWVRTAVGYGRWTAWAVYDRGNGVPPGPGGVLTAITNVPAMRVPHEPGGARYMPAGGGGSSLRTVNSDTSDDVTATAKITADLTTGVEFDAADPNTTLKGIDASVTQTGVVNKIDQVFAGRKGSSGGSGNPYVGGGFDAYGVTASGAGVLLAATGTLTDATSGVVAYRSRMLQTNAPFGGGGTFIGVAADSAISRETVSAAGSVGGSNAACALYWGAAQPAVSGGTVSFPALPAADEFTVGVLPIEALPGGVNQRSSRFAVARPFLEHSVFHGIDALFDGSKYPYVLGGIVVGVYSPSATAPPPPASPPVSPPTSPPPPPPVSPPSPPVTSPPPVPPGTALPPVSVSVFDDDTGELIGFIPPGGEFTPYQASAPTLRVLNSDIVQTGTVVAHRVILTSPNGSRFAVGVSDGGFVSVSSLPSDSTP